MAALCALKRTASFSPETVLAWYATLGTFPQWIINRAVLRLATSLDRFPEVGDLYQLCRKDAIRAGLMKEPYCPNGEPEKQKVTDAEIDQIGAAMGLPIQPRKRRE